MVKRRNQPGPELIKGHSSALMQIVYSILIIMVLDFLTGFILIKDNYNTFRTPHYYYHHGLKANQDTWAAWGSSLYPFRTNSLGMVDSADYKVNLRGNKNRLLILGDSHSEGVGVPYSATFSGILSRNLHDRTEVLNASCISYSPKIEYLKAKFLLGKGLKVDHIFVLIDISDMQNELVYEHFNPKKRSRIREAFYSGKNFLRKHSSVVYLLSSIAEKRQTNKFLKRQNSSMSRKYQAPRQMPLDCMPPFSVILMIKYYCPTRSFTASENGITTTGLKNLPMQALKWVRIIS